MTAHHPLTPSGRTLLAAITFAAGAIVGDSSHAAEPSKPECAALENWAVTIDEEDRVAPVEGSRAWIPQAFLEPAFAELFGVPALSWSYDAAGDMSAHVLECGHAAGNAGRMDARKALYDARGYFVSNLRGVLNQQARQEAAAQRAAEREKERREREAAASKLAAERAAERERQEAELRAQRAAQARARAEAQAEAQRQAQERPRPERQRQGTSGPAASTAGNVSDEGEAPISDYGEKLVADYRKKIAETEDSAASLQRLARWEQEIRQRIPKFAGDEAATALLEQIAAKLAPIRAATADGFMRSIDSVSIASDRTFVARIEEKVARAAKLDLTPEQFATIEAHARSRQQPRADRALAAAEEALDEFPESLKGLDALQEDFGEMRADIVDRGSEAARTSYLAAARARLTEIAREALPEFEEFVDGLEDEWWSMPAIELTAVGKDGFEEVDADVRTAYDAIIAAKRRRIEDAQR
ncbi:MAG: hypothetical protein CMM50_06845 [Rhodospirillaceae bacterium]|nr:hypothetical protein [Rhodospirillaceae bacterium]